MRTEKKEDDFPFLLLFTFHVISFLQINLTSSGPWIESWWNIQQRRAVSATYPSGYTRYRINPLHSIRFEASSSGPSYHILSSLMSCYTYCDSMLGCYTYWDPILSSYTYWDPILSCYTLYIIDCSTPLRSGAWVVGSWRLVPAEGAMWAVDSLVPQQSSLSD